MKDRAQKEETLARRAAALLRRDGEVLRGECPSADIMAAYLDRSLDVAERSRCEEHFAACARCQDALADLVRAETAAALRQPAESPALSRIWLFNWRWLAPAAAVLVVGVTVALVRQRLEPSVPLRSTATPSATLAEKSTPAVEAEARKDAQPFAPTKEEARPAYRAQQPPKAVARREAPAAKAGGESKREAQAAPPPSVAQNVVAEEAKVPPVEPVVADKAVRVAKPAPTGAAAAAPPAAEPQVGERRAGASRIAVVAAALPPSVVIASPDPAVWWRIGPAGTIERSADARRSWERQASGVRAALVAGSASSETTCWVVGVQGTILRTTDGRTWLIVNPPVLVDFVSVSARDALVATVVAADGRQFTTTDGGRTWRTP